MTQTDLADLVNESIGADELADYLVAPRGHYLGLYADGTVLVGEDVGQEIALDERPVARVKCPGLANLDMTWWRNGWECDHLDDEDVVRGCCRNGDVEDELNELRGKLAGK